MSGLNTVVQLSAISIMTLFSTMSVAFARDPVIVMDALQKISTLCLRPLGLGFRMASPFELSPMDPAVLYVRPEVGVLLPSRQSVPLLASKVPCRSIELARSVEAGYNLFETRPVRLRVMLFHALL